MAGDALEAIERAFSTVHGLCKPRGSEGAVEWVMRIPADVDRDPDLVIAAALGSARAEIQRLRAALGEGGWMPRRGDVGGPEATRDPIFLLQARELHITAQGLPMGVVWDADATEFRDEATGEAISIRAIHERYGDDYVRECWRTETVWFTREEATAWMRSHAYRHPDGMRVYCICAEGELAQILRARSAPPTGTCAVAPAQTVGA